MPGSGGVVTASASALAFTGPSPVVWFVGVAGAVLVLAGLSLLAMEDVSRRVIGRLVERRTDARP